MSRLWQIATDLKDVKNGFATFQILLISGTGSDK
jgi:hypothetical protein